MPSEYRGVYTHGNKWRMRFNINKELIYKRFENKIEAAKEYDNLIRLHNLVGKRPMNFPTAEEKEIEGDSLKNRYVGVRKRVSGNWQAQIPGKDVKTESLGTFKTEKEAAEAYDIRARELGRTNLNFPNGFQSSSNNNNNYEKNNFKTYKKNEINPKVPPSIYRGVNPHGIKFRMQIIINKKLIYKSFNTEIEAAKEYDRMVRLHNLTGRRPLNFPTDDERKEGLSEPTSKFIGVIKRISGRWQAQIPGIDVKTEYLGTFDNEREAAEAYDKRAREVGKKNLNFPNKQNNEYEASSLVAGKGKHHQISSFINSSSNLNSNSLDFLNLANINKIVQKNDEEMKSWRTAPPLLVPKIIKPKKQNTVVNKKKDILATTSSVAKKNLKKKESDIIVVDKTDIKEKEEEEWVQCDKCSKWRKLALGMSVSSLGDTWTCSLNTWDLQRNNCEVSQEVSDEEIDGYHKEEQDIKVINYKRKNIKVISKRNITTTKSSSKRQKIDNHNQVHIEDDVEDEVEVEGGLQVESPDVEDANLLLSLFRS